MIVTDLQYSLEKFLVVRLRKMCERCTGMYKHQNVILTDGKEGYGKSTLTAAAAYYMGYRMRRPVKLFFDPQKLMEYAREHKDEVLIWDDAAYAALTLESYNRLIIDLIKVIWLARKNRNTFLINIQEVFRLKEALTSRAVCLLHVYSPDKKKLGKFAYFTEKSLFYLLLDWTKRKKKSYQTNYDYRGSFPNVLYKIFDEKEYEDLKDEQILALGKEKTKDKGGSRGRYYDLYVRAAKGLMIVADKANLTLTETSRLTGASPGTLRKWRSNEEAGKWEDAPEQEQSSDTNNHCGYIEPIHQDYLKVPLKNNK